MAISRFFVDELLDGLMKLSETRRRACLFALEAELEPRDVTELTWREFLATDFPMTRMMSEAIATQVRHIRLPYVFWEYGTPHIATPLIKLRESIEGAFALPYGELQGMYRGMVMIDRRADARHFSELIQEIQAGVI